MINNPLIATLNNPGIIKNYNDSDWDVILRQSRSANLIAHIGYLFIDNNLQQYVPAHIFRHFQSAITVAERHQLSVLWEIQMLDQTLKDLSVPIILLKGAAYTGKQLAFSKGRVFSDIDIMVAKSSLNEVENKLISEGWQSQDKNPYDQKYYRQWMHELPPMTHRIRQTSLDVHHTISPPTGKLKPAPQKLLSNARKDKLSENIYWLDINDMILHSATHLFYEGEFKNGLRDLVDIHSLIYLHSSELNFWQELLQRGMELGLTKPLYYALFFSAEILGTAVPRKILIQARPRFGINRGLKLLFFDALRPHHASCNNTFSPFYRWLLYLRGHYLRMPLYLLIPHLIRKALTRDEAKDAWANKINKQLQK